MNEAEALARAWLEKMAEISEEAGRLREREIELRVAIEREECAYLAWTMGASDVADAIRTRGGAGHKAGP